MPGGKVHVEGVDELKRALRKADSDLKQEFKTEQKDASRKVAIITRSDLPHLTGKTISKVTALQASTKITTDWIGWLEFGGTRGRPFIKEGRFLFPAAKKVAPEFEKAVEDLLDKVNRRADLL